MSTGEHWDELYSGLEATDMGWYEAVPSTLEDVLALSQPGNSVIDIGAGSGHLVDELLDRGYRDITLVDISSSALASVAQRVAGRPEGTSVKTCVADVVHLRTRRPRHLWHDRAAFHFLTTGNTREGYKAALDRTLAPGGAAVIATFAADGPDSCAGLPVARYDESQLRAEFAQLLDCVDCRTSLVKDGDTDRRPYTVCRFRKHQGGT